MDSPTAEDRPALTDLIDPKRWQRLQNHFAGVLGVAIRTIGPSRELLVTPSWPGTLTADQVVRLLKVGEELEDLLPRRERPQTSTSLTTTLGVTYAAIPIRATADQVIAYFIVGPMVVGQREEELHFSERMAAAGASDVQALWSVLLSLKLYTFSGIRSMLNLMEEVGTALAQLAYQAKQLPAILPSTSKVDQAVVAYYTDRVLQSLLEAATLATRADGGSVMLYDAKSDALEIKVAQGLSDAVIANTRLKRGEGGFGGGVSANTRLRRGEGIAGLAATERSILLVDQKTNDPRLQRRMLRPEVCSSLVAPLTQDDTQEPIGILNLRNTTAQKQFTQEHVELLRRLLDIASIALRSLSFSLSPRTS